MLAAEPLVAAGRGRPPARRLDVRTSPRSHSKPPGSLWPRSTTARHCDTRTPCHSVCRRKGSSERPDVRRRSDPAGSLRIEVAELLQFSVLFLRQKVDAHRGGHLDGAALRLVFFPRLERFTVVADTSAAGWALCGAIAERVAARLSVLADDVRFAARGLHLAKRPQCIGIAFELGSYIGPRDSLVPVHVLLEASLQCLEKLFPFLRLHGPRSLGIAAMAVDGGVRRGWHVLRAHSRVSTRSRPSSSCRGHLPAP